MTIFRKIIVWAYPLQMKWRQLTGKGNVVHKNEKNIPAPEDFFALKATLNSGEEISFEQYRGRKILIVNVASECGYTPQYAELQKLYEKENDLAILAFPSNNFNSQEPGTDEDIQRFCKLKYRVTFPVFQKRDVIGPNRQPVYQWLTDPDRNGWNDHAPAWNFNKYLISEKGNLTALYSAGVSPIKIKF